MTARIEQVTPNFKLKEMEFSDPVPEALLENAYDVLKNLQVLREHVGKPITIISGYRSPERNKSVGGATKSQHMQGNAVDIKIDGLTGHQIADIVEKLIKEGKMKQGGVGRYGDKDKITDRSWCHYDTRGFASRWVG